VWSFDTTADTTQRATRRNGGQSRATLSAYLSRFCNAQQPVATDVVGLWLRRARVEVSSTTLVPSTANASARRKGRHKQRWFADATALDGKSRTRQRDQPPYSRATARADCDPGPLTAELLADFVPSVRTGYSPFRRTGATPPSPRPVRRLALGPSLVDCAVVYPWGAPPSARGRSYVACTPQSMEKSWMPPPLFERFLLPVPSRAFMR
jgi:hypothetical protein